MSDPIKITATVGAYLTEFRSMEDFVDIIRDPERREQAIGMVLTYSSFDMSKSWTHVGDAEITVTLKSPDEQVSAAIRALRGQIDKARAEYLQTQAECLERISKLQALTNEVEA